MPTVDLEKLLVDWGGEVADGIHWPAELHARAGLAIASTIAAALCIPTDRSRHLPGDPGYDEAVNNRLPEGVPLPGLPGGPMMG